MPIDELKGLYAGREPRIRIALDPELARSSMKLWRDALDLRIPVHDEFKIHFMQQRGPILRNYERTASAWMMLLRQAAPEPDDEPEFAALVSEIESFGAWAKSEIEALDGAIKEAIEVGLDELLERPAQSNEGLRDLFSRKPPWDTGFKPR